MRRLLFACITCAVALLIGTPTLAYAVDGSYSINELSTSLAVEPDASAHVVERQTLTFTNYPVGLVWYLRVPGDGESVRINSVRVAPVDDGGTLLGDWTRLQMVDSKPREQGQKPGDIASAQLRSKNVQPWYSYNIGDGMMRCYFHPMSADSESGELLRTYVIETDYSVSHCAYAYRDVGELYWRYANDSLQSDAENVSLVVKLPAPEGSDPEVVVAEINAWGHGPDEGTFTISGDATVTYRVSCVEKGNYAEAHVVFPVSWLSDLHPDSPNQYSELRRSDAQAEESEWVDTGLRGANWDNKVRVLFLIIAIIVIVLGVIGVIRRGRGPLARRSLVRAATTLALVALAEHLFFREPLTTAMLGAFAAIVAIISFMLPDVEDEGDEEENEEAE